MYFECILVSIKKYPNIRSILFNWMFSIHVLFSPSNPGAYSEKNIKIQIIPIFSQFHLMSPDDIFLIKIYKLIYNLSSRYLIKRQLFLNFLVEWAHDLNCVPCSFSGPEGTPSPISQIGYDVMYTGDDVTYAHTHLGSHHHW